MVFKIVPTITSGSVTLHFGGTNGSNPPNFIPFTTILSYLEGGSGLTIAFLNLAGNIALLMPIGFLISLIYRDIRWKKVLIVGVLSGLTIELLQTVLKVGIFDIDDVILNALGVFLGFVAYVYLAKWKQENKRTHLVLSALLVIAAIAGSFYIVYPHNEPSVTRRIDVERTILTTGDLCDGTGGTGEIIDKGNNAITIKSKAGITQLIHLSDNTMIKTSAGPASETDLTIGDHVTVVIMDESSVATTVLVCGEK